MNCLYCQEALQDITIQNAHQFGGPVCEQLATCGACQVYYHLLQDELLYITWYDILVKEEWYIVRLFLLDKHTEVRSQPSTGVSSLVFSVPFLVNWTPSSAVTKIQNYLVFS